MNRRAPTPGKTLAITAAAGDQPVVAVLKALSSETRIAMLGLLGDGAMAATDIARELALAPSTATMHISILEKAHLVHSEMRPAVRGLQKLCTRTYDHIDVTLPQAEQRGSDYLEHSMPVGAYYDCSVQPTCGLASGSGIVGFLDDPSSFFEPARVTAQLAWFRSGHLEYRFPNRVPPASRISSLQVSAEVCSEAPLHDPHWPSDISVWINGVHLGFWTSPGDFGGERGRLTPAWWEAKESQFGVLKRWRVTAEGTTIDGVDLSRVCLDDLHLRPGEPIRVRFGIAPDAQHVGGLNLFGREFGNYPQDIVLAIAYRSSDDGSPGGRNI